MTTEHVLTPDDKCPCGKPQEGSGYCSYECYSKHEPPVESTSVPTPSDTDRLAEGPAPLTDEQVARFAELIDMHRQYGPALSIEGEAQLLVEVLRLRAEVTSLRGRLDTAEGHADDLRAALERRLLQVRSLRSGGPKKVNPLVCTTPVTTVETEIEDARVWWEGFDRESVVQTFGLREAPARALGLGEGDGQ